MQELMPTQLWLRPRMRVISEKSPQRSASFLVRCRFGVARGRLWRKAAGYRACPLPGLERKWDFETFRSVDDPPAHRVCSVHVSAARGSAAHVGGDQLKPSDKRLHPSSGVLDRLSYLGEVRSGRSRNATCLGMLPRRALKRGTAKSRNARNLTGMNRFGE